tara:strand:- start:3854 stop:5695 length:1842 start_codon:yes stop_codon:yes gene_type:complete
MARVTGKYDIKFQRGQGAFSQLLDQYVGIRQKRGREQYLMRLKQASPQNAYDRLKDARRGKAKLLQEYAKAMRPTGRPGYTKYSSKGSTLPAKFREENLEFADQYRRGLGEKADSDFVASVKGILRRLNQDMLQAFKEDGDPNSKKIQTARKDFSVKMEKLYTEYAAPRGSKRQSGYSEGITQAILDLIDSASPEEGIGNAVRAAANVSIQKLIRRNKFETIDPNLLQTYRAGRLDENQKNIAAADMRGSSTKMPSTQMSASDRKTIQDFYISEIEKYDNEIAEASQEFEDAKLEYERLLRGPDVNLALAPIAFRPSRVGERIDRFSDIVQADPSLAQDFVDADFEDFNPYEDLQFLPNAAGKSPIKIVLESAINLDKVFGVAEQRPVTKEDISLVQQEMKRLSDSLSSPIFDEDDFGNIKAAGKEYNTKEFIKLAPKLIEKAKDEAQKIKITQQIVDAFRSYEASMTNDQLNQLNQGKEPSSKISKRIDQTLQEKRYLDETGDTKPLRQSLSQLYKDVSLMPSEVRGQIGDSALLLLEQFESLPEDERDYGTVAFRLDNLNNVAKDLSAKQTLGLTPPIVIPEDEVTTSGVVVTAGGSSVDEDKDIKDIIDG